ncbi:MAG: BCCT family transporter [Desulfobacterales bacterium]|nr:BCCT family transporter [Desulfobacterales bacterium]
MPNKSNSTNTENTKLKPAEDYSGVLGKINKPLFWSASLFVLGITLIGFFFSESFSNTLKLLQSKIATNFGWLYLIICALYIVTGGFIALTKYGDIKLGKASDEPEFSFYAWIAMLFSCGVGVGFIFWGIAEPLYHWQQTPYLAEAGSKEAISVAQQICILHWGIHGWILFAVIGAAIAIPAYRYGKPMTVGISLYGLFGEKATRGFWGWVVDFISAFATVAGISASLGMGIMSFKYGFSALLGIELGTGSMVTILLIMIAGYILSACSGLQRGIRILSTTNITLAFGVLLFFLFFGPTTTLINTVVDSVGDYLRNFIFMSFWTDPEGQAFEGKWLGWWTIFYWGWWISWGPFAGGFLARISRGRTLRQYILGASLVPTAIAAIWFGIVGNSAIQCELAGSAELWKAVQADVGSGIFVLLSTYPLGTLVSFVVMFNLLIFIITSADSASFFVAMQMSKGELEPRLPMKLIWGLLIGSLAIVLLITGGLKALQTAAIVSAFPFAFIMIMILISLYKLLKKVKDDEAAARKA